MFKYFCYSDLVSRSNSAELNPPIYRLPYGYRSLWKLWEKVYNFQTEMVQKKTYELTRNGNIFVLLCGSGVPLNSASY